jgi:hypothetical protein
MTCRSLFFGKLKGVFRRDTPETSVLGRVVIAGAKYFLFIITIYYCKWVYTGDSGTTVTVVLQ